MGIELSVAYMSEIWKDPLPLQKSSVKTHGIRVVDSINKFGQYLTLNNGVLELDI